MQVERLISTLQGLSKPWEIIIWSIIYISLFIGICKIIRIIFHVIFGKIKPAELAESTESRGTTMDNRWVVRERASWCDLWASTSERRLVTVASGSPIEIIPIGNYQVPFLRKYDSLAFVSMGPKQVDVSLKGNAGTSDGVGVEGKVSVQVIIRDEESCVKRIATDPNEEERLLRDSILTVVQETISSHTWHLMMSIGEEFAQTAEQELSELLGRTASCFMVKSLTVQEIRPQNKAFAESLEKAAKAKEEEKLQRDLLQLRAEKEALERKAKEEELKSKLQMQKLQHQWELEAEREQVKLQQEKDDAQISTQKKLSELLETEPGMLAAHPEETFAYKSKEQDVEMVINKEKEKILREWIRSTQSKMIGRMLGRFDLMEAVLERHLNIRLSEVSEDLPMLPPEEETQQINDKSKDSSTTIELSDEENT